MTALQLLLDLPRIRRGLPVYLLEQVQRRGEVLYADLRLERVFFFARPEDVETVLIRANDLFSKDTFQYRSLALLTGQGLLTADDPPWKANRQKLHPFFRQEQLEQLGAIVLPVLEARMQQWSDQVDLEHEMLQVAMEVVGRYFFGLELREQAGELVTAILGALDALVARSQSLLPNPWRHARLQRIIRSLDEALDELVERRCTYGAGPDLLWQLLEAGADRQWLRDELVTLLVAGHETVATGLAWTLWLLGRHLDVQQRLREEVAGQTLSVSALRQLPFVRAVFSEGLRLYPPAWIISRRAVADCQVGSTTVPQGTVVILSPYVTHRVYWDDGERFLPERFLAHPHPKGYFPFGLGPRRCIGDRFGLIEGTLVLARIAQCFQWKSLSDPHPPTFSVTLRPRGGVHVQLRRLEGIGAH